MVKRCQWGLCKSDNRFPERLEGGIKFIPFPKPKRNLEKCLRWVKACGRPHDQLNAEKIDGNYHMFVCTKHFPEGGPSDQFPDPYMVDSSAKYTPCRAPPKRRPMSEPPKKRRKILSEVSTFTDENCMSSPLVVTDSNLTDLQKQETSDYSQYPSPEPQISPLDMLALAAENMDMKRKMAEQAFENQQLKIVMYKQHQTMADHIRENENLRIEIAKTKQSVNVNSEKPVSKKYGFNVEYVRDSQVRDNFKYYTGFAYEQFMNIFRFLVPFSGESPLTFPRTITSVKKIRLQDQLLLALVKLRLNFEFKHIANLFEISPQDAGAIFRGWINYMYYRFGSVSIWPDREVLIQHMPAKFKEDFPTTFVILDGTELKVERPSSLRSQSQCYSDYKSATTLKGLVGIDPRGSFTFISMLFSGSISDKEITKQSGLLSLLKQLLDCSKLKPGDGVMVDKGFLIREEIEALGLKLFMPPFAPGAGQMSAGDVKLTKKIAAHRVHVERAISRSKKFKIVDDRIDLSLFPCVNQIWFCCCFLTSFMPFLIQE